MTLAGYARVALWNAVAPLVAVAYAVWLGARHPVRFGAPVVLPILGAAGALAFAGRSLQGDDATGFWIVWTCVGAVAVWASGRWVDRLFGPEAPWHA